MNTFYMYHLHFDGLRWEEVVHWWSPTDSFRNVAYGLLLPTYKL